jgi:dTDP-4-dehydrorhamnose 3,5-epimerase
MKVTPADHPEILLVEPAVFNDARGFFKEMFHAEKYQANGMPGVFVQDNHSRSARGVLRGLHYQLKQQQGKLVSVVAGEVFDVAVDIRKGSPRFGQWVGMVLSGENHHQLYIPPGFAHGFCVLSEYADFFYKCTDYYAPGDEYGIIWNDSDIAIEWPQTDYLLSDSDRALPRLSDSDHLPSYRPVGR